MFQDYVSHFNVVTLKVHDPDQLVAMSALKGALRSQFLFSLEKRYPKDFMKISKKSPKSLIGW